MDVSSYVSEEEGDELKDALAAQAAPWLEGESMDTEAAATAQEAPLEPYPFSARARNRLAKFEVAMVTVLANQTMILLRLDCIQ